MQIPYSNQVDTLMHFGTNLQDFHVRRIMD